jgi:serine/threonine-protein kinase
VHPDRWQQVRQVFASVCEIPTERRGAFLDEACAGDSALRGEVESILAASEQAPAFLDSPALASFADLLTLNQPQALIGRRVGVYEITDVVASGGMGTVYRALRVDGQLAQVVAIKFIRAGIRSSDLLDRFRRERQTLAGLDHQHIARLLDVGVTDDGQPYLVMEFVDGKPIDEYCDEHQLNTVERLKLFRTVCMAVQYAHQHLVVHRDLKPGNIFVTLDGVVKLLDFGVAKVLEPESSEALAATAETLQPRMTPEYASPEQFRGELVTTATDTYSLGVVLYGLLTGHRPYRGNSRLFQDVARSVCEEEPERPSTVVRRAGEVTTRSGETRVLTPEVVSRTRDGHPEKLRRRLAGDIDAIVLMALRKDPQHRYASVELLSEDIRRYLDGLPVVARRSTLMSRSAKFVRRHKAVVTAVSAAVLSLLAGVIATTWTAQVARRERNAALEAERFAEQEMANAIVEARKAEQVIRFLQKTLSSADPNQLGRDVTVREILETAVETVATEFADDPEAESAVRTSIGTTLTGLGRYDDAEVQLRAAVEIQRRIHGAPHWDVANALNSLGVLLYSKGDLVGAESCCSESLAIHRALYGDHHPDVATTLNNLGVLVRLRGDPVRAEQLLQEALAIRRELYGNEHLEVAETLNNMAMLRRQQGDMSAAEPLYQEALAIRRKLLGDNHARVAQSMDNLATALMEKGDLQSAEALMREALRSYRQLVGNNHPDVAITLQNLAGLLVNKDDPMAAEPLFRESLEIRRRALPPNDARTADTAARLGNCLRMTGRYGEAETLLLEGLTTLRTSLGLEHARTQWVLQALINLYTGWEKPEEAARYQALLSGSQPSSQPRSPESH